MIKKRGVGSHPSKSKGLNLKQDVYLGTTRVERIMKISDMAYNFLTEKQMT